ncbi:MAG: hypothetical protein LBL75_03795 [Rickettsiales bacterium]|jgi:hypothetical protein|nr:hypothetical protein [Rickettsiales bacterium]
MNTTEQILAGLDALESAVHKISDLSKNSDAVLKSRIADLTMQLETEREKNIRAQKLIDAALEKMGAL